MCLAGLWSSVEWWRGASLLPAGGAPVVPPMPSAPLKDPCANTPAPELPATRHWTVNTHGLAPKISGGTTSKRVIAFPQTINREIGLHISTCLGFIWPTREVFIIAFIPHHTLPLTLRSGSLFGGVVTQHCHMGRVLWMPHNSTEHTYDFLCLHRVSRHLAHCLRHAPFLFACVLCQAARVFKGTGH